MKGKRRNDICRFRMRGLGRGDGEHGGNALEVNGVLFERSVELVGAFIIQDVEIGSIAFRL